MNLIFNILVLSLSTELKNKVQSSIKGLPIRFTFIQDFEEVNSHLSQKSFHLFLVDYESKKIQWNDFVRKMRLTELKSGKKLGKTILLKKEKLSVNEVQKNDSMNFEILTYEYFLNNLDHILFTKVTNKPKIEEDDSFVLMQKKFLENRVVEYDMMLRALEIGNFTEVKRLAHSLKGVCSLYGYPEFSEVAKSIESSAVEENEGECLKLFENYLTIVESANSQLI